MSDTFHVDLTLTADTPQSMNFADTYIGLNDIWYKFEADAEGNIYLSANADGFEHLARYFLKLARSGKMPGYHAHHPLEFGEREYIFPEVTISVCEKPLPPTL